VLLRVNSWIQFLLAEDCPRSHTKNHEGLGPFFVMIESPSQFRTVEPRAFTGVALPTAVRNLGDCPIPANPPGRHRFRKTPTGLRAAAIIRDTLQPSKTR